MPAALRMDGCEVSGRRLRMDWAGPSQSGPAGGAGKRAGLGRRTGSGREDPAGGTGGRVRGPDVGGEHGGGGDGKGTAGRR